MQRRRLSKRIPSILEGRIRLESQASQIPCTIRDISMTGARIWLPGPVDLPGEFELEIPLLEQAVRVRVMWSNDRTHGVTFLEALREPAGADALGLMGKLRAPDEGISHTGAVAKPSLPARKSPQRPVTLWQRLVKLLLPRSS
jgi:hypothetical protein